MAEATLAAELLTPSDDALPQRRDASLSKVPVVPVPVDAPQMRFRHQEHGELSASWPYHNSNGDLIGYVCRWDYTKADGTPGKTYRPVCYCNLGDGRRAWRSSGFPEPRPLYRLPDILARPDATIILTEGEKACDAAKALFPDFVVTTPPHGAKSPQRADWSLLRGRKVVIWPDHDEAGCKFATAVAEIAIEASAASVHIVDIPADFPDKWDLADVLPEGWIESDREALISDATLFEAEPDNGGASDDAIVNGIPERFRLAGNGVSFKEDNDSHWESVCSRLDVVAETRDTSGEAWGRLLRVKDRDGNLHEWAMPMAMLATDGADYRRHLLSLGLEIAPGTKARNELHEYISKCRPKERARCVARIGWHGDDFVLPDGTIGPTGGERIVLQLEGRTDHAFYTQGALAEWQEQIGEYAAGNSRLVMAISTAFAGPLLNLIDAESGGFHFRGASSIGKTTALAVAGSVWGGGGGVKGYIRQWRATDNGLEAVAQEHCDTLLCLDELSQIDARHAGATAYMLANGAGKSRAGRAGEGRKPAEWRVMFLSTGEIGIADKVAEDGRGRKVTAGQKVRVIDLAAEAGAGLGLFEDLHGFDSPDAFARHLRQAANEIYGEPARAFLAAITGHLDDLRESLPGFINEFVAEHCPKQADGQVQRVAQRFALVAAAGELATNFSVLSWTSGEATKGVVTCFQAWLAARGGIEPAEVTAAIAQVRHFIEQHGESRFAPWDGGDDRRTINRAGFRRTIDGCTEYYVLPQVWKQEVCAGFDPGMVVNALVGHGILIPDSTDKKPQSRHRLPGHKNPVRCYRLADTILGGDADA